MEHLELKVYQVLQDNQVLLGRLEHLEVKDR